MPIERHTLTRSSFVRKLLAYQATWANHVHSTRFGFNRFRVLTVTTSTERVQHLVDACGTLERGDGLFLFAALNEFTTHPDILAARFPTGHAGRSSGLLELPTKQQV